MKWFNTLSPFTRHLIALTAYFGITILGAPHLPAEAVKPLAEAVQAAIEVQP